MLMFLLHLITSVTRVLCSFVAAPDSLGKEYILTFIAGSSSDGDIGLLITTAKPYVVYVTVSADGVPAASRQVLQIS